MHIAQNNQFFLNEWSVIINLVILKTLKSETTGGIPPDIPTLIDSRTQSQFSYIINMVIVNTLDCGTEASSFNKIYTINTTS